MWMDRWERHDCGVLDKPLLKPSTAAIKLGTGFGD
jgi:hypothetical protein